MSKRRHMIKLPGTTKVSPYRFKRQPQYIDWQGREIPGEIVSDLDAAREHLVQKIWAMATRFNAQAENFLKKALEEVDKFRLWKASRFEYKYSEIGNTETMAYSGKFKVVVSSSEYLVWTDDLREAQRLISEVINENISNSRLGAALSQIFIDTFANPKGVSYAKLNALKKYSVDDPRWKKACEIIERSSQSFRGKRRLNVYSRTNESQWKNLPLNISDIEVD